MTEPQVCTRHHRRVWIASCTDCTAWHLAALDVRHEQPKSQDGAAPAASAA